MPFREVLLLARLRLCNLLVIQVTLVELLMKGLEVKTLDDVDRVDDVSERLAHLTAVSVTDHRVAVNLLERHFVCEVNAEHDHTGDPEEQDVPAGLQNG